jgi:biotin synthase-like enzyme
MGNLKDLMGMIPGVGKQIKDLISMMMHLKELKP